MRWQRVARTILVVVGLGFAAGLYLMTRARPEADPPPPLPPPADRDAVQISGAGRQLLVRDGKTTGTVEYASAHQYPDGRIRFTTARFLDARGFSVTADAIHARGGASVGATPSEITCEGHVVLEDADAGLKVETSRAVYQDVAGVLTMPEMVTFTRGRLSGSGVGAVYHRDNDTVQFLADAQARVGPDAAGQGALEASSKTMTLLRGQQSLLMDENARIASASETLTGDAATLAFTEDESALKFLELRGRASVTPSNPQAGGIPDMRAGNISMTFHPDGRTVEHSTLTGEASLQLAGATGTREIRGSRIDVFTAPDGKTLTRLEANDKVVVLLPATGTAPAREIRSAALLATGKAGAGLENARFDNDVQFIEKVAGKSDRTATSRVLVLGLAGELDAIRRAEFQRDVVFVDGAVTAHAELGIYDAIKERLTLTPGKGTPNGRARVQDARVTVDAPSIDIDLKTHDLSATGGATTRSVNASATRPALFEGDDPVLGSAASVAYQSATGSATYTGKAGAPARVVQGKNIIEGATIALAEDKGNLDATGSVTTVFQMAAAAGGAPVEYRTTAQAFSYDDARRTVIYRAPAGQALAQMTGSDDTVIEGRTITLRLAAESRTVEGFDVAGQAYARLPGDYEAVAETLTFTAETELYVLTGKARVKSPDAERKNCTLTSGEEITFRKGGAVGQRKSRAFARTDTVACSTPIR